MEFTSAQFRDITGIFQKALKFGAELHRDFKIGVLFAGVMTSFISLTAPCRITAMCNVGRIFHLQRPHLHKAGG